MNAGRLPFGVPSINAAKEFGNGNYLWISYFYAYLNEKGRAGFVMASSATDSSGKDRDIRQKLVETGHVDVMMSVGNNFFYTKSLPCSIWFFDKGKAETIQDHVLFIDARNYYTVVDRTLNEWSEWQLKNLNAIVWLYRGEVDKYKALLQQYKDTFYQYATESADRELDEMLRWHTDFATLTENLKGYLEAKRLRAKECIETVEKRKKKAEQAKWDEYIAWVEEIIGVAAEANWLYEKFGEGEYQDIPDLCKMASRAEIAEKNYSLTPGAYVGVAAVEDDGVDFAQRMGEIHLELLKLQAESNELMQTISRNMKEMGL
jgi:type I restriction enzyme M protein